MNLFLSYNRRLEAVQLTKDMLLNTKNNYHVVTNIFCTTFKIYCSYLKVYRYLFLFVIFSVSIICNFICSRFWCILKFLSEIHFLKLNSCRALRILIWTTAYTLSVYFIYTLSRGSVSINNIVVLSRKYQSIFNLSSNAWNN